jgi:hypothetical protein
VPSPFSLIFSSAFSGLGTDFFQASAQMPPRGIYSDVTLSYGCVDACTSRIYCGDFVGFGLLFLDAFQPQLTESHI